MSWLVLTILLSRCILPIPAGAQKYEELAMTPPMGWNSWNHFGCDINEEIVREVADAMVSSGMREAGYEYLNIDDCWHARTRDSSGRLQPDPVRFPSGMKALGDYVHRRGLKVGIYSDAGATTCGGFPGSRDKETIDAETFAEWGVDYLKYDWCDAVGIDPVEAYGKMGQALLDAGRPVVFSVCEWGLNQPWEWAARMGHLWRISGDITNCFDCLIDHGGWYSYGIVQIMDQAEPLRRYAGPGHWNDPDMMEVGNGLTQAENRAHFSMWSMLAAPLIAGNDVRTMSDETRKVLTNKEVIAVNQDPLGIQGFRYLDVDGVEVWFRPLAQGDWAAAILNRSSADRTLEFDWSEERVLDDFTHRDAGFEEISYRVRDLWKGEDIGTTEQPIFADVASHDVLMLRLSPIDLSGESESSGWQFRLFPNPATTYARIQVRAEASGKVNFTVFDSLGRVAARPLETELTAGIYSFDWLLDDLPSGTYYVQSLSAGGTVVKGLSIVR
ncbi:MAG TPA: T9SS type A sorting domain-containing protein [Rhodothermales bacterium]|nr:T9SS type A sorting domain-containing protein [Rhodothermales bacterium]